VSNFWYHVSSGELKDNSGYARRLNNLSKGNSIEPYGRLHADLFNSDKMLINVLDMNIKLTRAPESFYLLDPSDENKFFLSLKSNLKPLFY